MRSLIALASCLLLSASAWAGTLQDEVKRLAGAMGPRKGTIAISVREDDGKEVVNLKGDVPVMPASNQKLLTTGAALRMLGTGFVFRTRVLRSGDRLTVVGDGDPAFGDPDQLKNMSYREGDLLIKKGLTIDELLGLWTRAARASGITEVRELVIDDRVFDQSTCHADWPVDQLNESYCAEVSGLNFHANRLDFWAAPSPRGAEITRTEPACRFVGIRNATSPGRTRDDAIWIQREPDSNAFTVRGFLRKPITSPVGVSLDSPSLFFGNLLAERLRDAGVKVGSVRLAGPGDPPATGETVGPVFETPIASAITHCNVESQNLYAESLLKRIGHASTGQPGSWNNGTEAVEREVSRRLKGAPGLDAADGSGLSRENRVTASIVTAWVSDLVRDPTVSRVFIDSLAVGGQSGTVKKRFRDIDPALATVHCKTGYIDGVCALSGVVECANGRCPTFSVICNGFEGDGVGRAKQLQEAVAKAVAKAYGSLPSAQPPAERPALGGG